jgi:anaerobic ribonucleoside-triphosphate reductase activating protein
MPVARAGRADVYRLFILRFRSVKDRSVQRLLNATDLLVDGPFVSNQPEPHRALAGSTNQRFIHFTPRYLGLGMEATAPNRLEARVSPNGTVDLAGFLTNLQLDAFLASTNLGRVNRGVVNGSG